MLHMAMKPVGKMATQAGNLFGGMFGGPGPLGLAAAVGMASGQFNPHDFWGGFNSFPGMGRGGGAVGLEGMANFAAARGSGMGGGSRIGGDGYREAKDRTKAERSKGRDKSYDANRK
jgi:hypothetical protein